MWKSCRCVRHDTTPVRQSCHHQWQWIALFFVWIVALLQAAATTKVAAADIDTIDDVRCGDPQDGGDGVDDSTISCSIPTSSSNSSAGTTASSTSPINLYQEIDGFLFTSYLVQDIALFNHWDEIVGNRIAPLQEPDFFRTLPKTVSQVLHWTRQNMESLRAARWKTLRQFDPDFDLMGLEMMAGDQEECSNKDDDDRCSRSATVDDDDEEATIEVLDDKFGFHGIDSHPVYAIAREPTLKRIVVVFRGSITPRDWQQDFKAQEKEVPLTPEEVSRDVPNANHSLLQGLTAATVHRGFHEYLFEQGMDQDQNSKFSVVFSEIQKHLKDPKNRGYSLYFTGHSLGGALATLAALATSASNDLNDKLPIRLITFASPHAGKLSFYRVFERFQEAGRIQHLRITNHDDAVPLGMQVLGYAHTGVHLNLLSSPSDKGQGNEKTGSIPPQYYTLANESLPSQEPASSFFASRIHWKWFFGNPSHLLQEHKKRLDKSRYYLERLTLDDLFDTARKQ